MKLWIRLFRNYLHWFTIAKREFGQIMEDMIWLVEKFKGLKEDPKYIMSLLEGTSWTVKA
jgi:hypothetical protein